MPSPTVIDDGAEAGPAGERTALRRATELRVGRTVDVRMALDPYVSTLALGIDAFAGQGGVPAAWRRRILGALPARGAQAIHPLAVPGRSVVPGSVKPLNPTTETAVGDQVERLRAIPGERLLEDLEAAFPDGDLPPHWRRVADRPGDWLHRYADTMDEIWGAVEPLWEEALPLLEREIERVGAAFVRGGLGTVLAALHPAVGFEDGSLRVPDPEPARFALGGRPLVLVPMLSAVDALICDFDDSDAVWIAYPLPALDPAACDPPDPASLEAMLGPVRAALLRAVARPLTMGELARLTQLSPSAVTHHCERLVASGLVRRERQGREIRIHQTGRGRRIVGLFPPDPRAL
ncbi:winged helix-turn-helix transcriptional regulator [Actinomadura graeca]|uniref:Winged helix-turn-helix transcriptional regulator n=1 Tax=Actinomadura graeca TaxID=2750812 RepID=A0ABX8QYE5_9ACTN|nr:winged helix-turn-helix domain-containing protein [Actinomadura graeca]QXJ23762.1 winged helix-turn-helix transcriptional regulator [Actinomadura graeca]